MLVHKWRLRLQYQIFIYTVCIVSSFQVFNFDVLNVGPCTQYQSSVNPTEGCMSLVNIDLQGLTLKRDNADPYMSTVKSCSTMKSICRKATDCRGLKEVYTSSTDTPILKVEMSFSMLDLRKTS